MIISIGVHDQSQLRTFRYSSFLGRRRNIALDLIDDINQEYNESLWRVLLERAVDGKGISKRTYPARFPEFAALILSCLDRSRPGDWRFLDAAVSDGSTALDFFRQIERGFTERFHFIATDRDGNYKVISEESKNRERVIVSCSGEVVQAVYPPFIFDRVPSRDNLFLFPMNRAMRPFIMRRARKLVERWKSGDAQIRQCELRFLSWSFCKTLNSDRRLSFEHWDVTKPWPGDKVHCLRAMNILNPDYFSREQMRQIILNFKDCLLDCGLLAIGSNGGPGSEVDGAIYKVERGRLRILKQTGNGFRCNDAGKDLVLSITN